MRLRMRLVAIVAAFMQATAPFAAYAIAMPGPGIDDVCSAARPQKPAPPQAPANSPIDRHASSHCVLCGGGSVADALPAPFSTSLAIPGIGSSRIDSVPGLASRDARVRPRARGPPVLA